MLKHIDNIIKFSIQLQHGEILIYTEYTMLKKDYCVERKIIV